MASENLKFYLEALYKGGGVQAAKRDLQSLSSTSDKVTKAQEAMAAASKRAEAGMSLQAQKAEALAQKHEELLKATKLGTVAFGAMAAAGTALIVSSTTLAARVETLGVVVHTVGKTAGYSADEMDAFEASIKKQGITTQAARQSLAMMAQAQVDFAEGSRLARIAQDTAVIANLNSSEAFERLVYVLQTANVRMGRTLGLNLDFQGSYERLAATLGTTADKLDEQQKMQARVNEVTRAGKTITGTYEAAMDTAGKQMLSFKRYTDEIQLVLGQAFLPTLTKVIEAATSLSKKFLDLNTHSQRTTAIALGLGTALAAAIAGVGGLTIAVNALGFSIGVATGGLTILLGLFAALAVYAAADAMATAQLREEFDEQAKALIRSTESYQEYRKELEKLAEELGINLDTSKKLYETYLEIDPITGVMTESVRELEQATIGLNEAEYENITATDYLRGDLFELNKEARAAAGGLELAGDSTRSLAYETSSAVVNVGDLVLKHKEWIEWFEGGGYAAMLRADEIMRQYRDGIISAADAMRGLTQIGNQQFVADAVKSGATFNKGSRSTADKYTGEYQHGGRLNTGVAKVGEAGWEYIINGVVVPHQQSKDLARLGLSAGRSFAVGGMGEFDEGESYTMPHYTYDPSSSGKTGYVATGSGTAAAPPPAAAPVVAIEAAVEAAVETAQASTQQAAMVSSLMTENIAAQSEKMQQQINITQRDNADIKKLLIELIQVNRDQGTSKDTANALASSLQFYEPG